MPDQFALHVLNCVEFFPARLVTATLRLWDGSEHCGGLAFAVDGTGFEISDAAGESRRIEAAAVANVTAVFDNGQAVTILRGTARGIES